MQQLSGKWLASFDMYDTYSINDPEIDRRYVTPCRRVLEILVVHRFNLHDLIIGVGINISEIEFENAKPVSTIELKIVRRK